MTVVAAFGTFLAKSFLLLTLLRGQKGKTADEKLKNIRAYVDMETEVRAKKHKVLVEKAFKMKTFGYQIYVIFALLYGLLVTVFTAVKNFRLLHFREISGYKI